VKQTYTDGVTSQGAARFGVIEDGIFDAHNMPAARVFHSANQSITTATETTLAFDSERFDTDTIHDTVTNNSRLTCKHAGVYVIGAHVQFDSGAAGGARYVSIMLNGTTTYIAIQK